MTAIKRVFTLALVMALLAVLALMLAQAVEAGSRLAIVMAAAIVAAAVAVPVGLTLAMNARPVTKHYHLHVDQPPLNVQRTVIERVDRGKQALLKAPKQCG